jgi:hypothetical protein
MLHTQTVDARMLALIKDLMNDTCFNDFVLVGGTALSLQIGHRKSIDIDLFTKQTFDHEPIMNHLAGKYNAKEIRHSDSAVYSKINGIKLDLVTEPLLILNKPQTIDGIRMIDPEEIAVMKLQAIIDSGKRLKDFVDIHFLLEYFTLEKMTTMLVNNYPDVVTEMAHRSLLYHVEIDMGKKAEFIGYPIPFSSISKRLHQAVSEPKATFKGITEEKNKVQRRGRRM